MPGRIQTYTHSDSTTPNKGGVILEVTCETDFGARTPQFIKFAEFVAQAAYGSGKYTWPELCAAWPAAEQAKGEVEAEIKETITVRQIQIVKLTDAKVLKAERDGSKG